MAVNTIDKLQFLYDLYLLFYYQLQHIFSTYARHHHTTILLK